MGGSSSCSAQIVGGLRTIGAQQCGVTGEVISPMPGSAALPFDPQCPAHACEEAGVLCKIRCQQFVRPEREKTRQVAPAVIVGACFN